MKSAQRLGARVAGLLDDTEAAFQARLAAFRERKAAEEAMRAQRATQQPPPPVAGLLDDPPPAMRYDGPADAISLRGYHYGIEPHLHSLSGRAYGRGAKGREAERVGLANDPRIRQRVYFYGEQGGMIPRAEPVVMGNHVYRADLSGLYLPGRSDPSVLKGARSEGQFDANTFERLLLDHGYSGYFNPDYNQAVLLGRDVPVQYLGTRYDLKDRIKR